MPSTLTHAPRGALVFDMRQLGRQAGSALTQTRIVPAPDDLQLELIGVPVGADVALEVRFEAVSEGVLATGTAIAPLAGERSEERRVGKECSAGWCAEQE